MIRTVRLEDGCRFTGEFEGDVRHGQGVKTYPNGATYRGVWVFDLRHGPGCKTTATGIVKHVEYNYGERVFK